MLSTQTLMAARNELMGITLASFKSGSRTGNAWDM
jgi:hypothetical protein